MHDEDFDPETAVPADEVEEKEGREDRIAELEAEHKAMYAKIEVLEKRVHQLASRPPPKDNTKAIIDAFQKATESLCQAIMKRSGGNEG